MRAKELRRIIEENAKLRKENAKLRELLEAGRRPA